MELCTMYVGEYYISDDVCVVCGDRGLRSYVVIECVYTLPPHNPDLYSSKANNTTSQLRKSLVFTDVLTRWFIYGGGSLMVRNFLCTFFWVKYQI